MKLEDNGRDRYFLGYRSIKRGIVFILFNVILLGDKI